MIRGQKISLLALESRHLDQTRAWANDPELARLLNRARPVSDHEHDQWFRELHRKSDLVYFAIEAGHEKKHVGNVWLWDIDWRHRRCELRIVIGDKSRLSQGIGTESIELASHFAFSSLNMHKVYAYVLAINPRAKRAFEKAGFTTEGTLKADRWAEDHYTDVFLMGKLNEPAT